MYKKMRKIAFCKHEGSWCGRCPVAVQELYQEILACDFLENKDGIISNIKSFYQHQKVSDVWKVVHSKEI